MRDGFREKFENVQLVSLPPAEPKPAAGLDQGVRSLRLTAQERRNVELILLAVVMHRSLPAVLVETLGCRTPGVFGHRFGPRFGRPLHWPPGKPLDWLRHGRRLS